MSRIIEEHTIEAMWHAVSEAAGQPVTSVHSACRTRPLPACRWIVGDAIVNMGYSVTYASHVIGISHATLLHGRKMISKFRNPKWSRINGWGLEHDIYVQFRNIMENQDGQKV